VLIQVKLTERYFYLVLVSVRKTVTVVKCAITRMIVFRYLTARCFLICYFCSFSCCKTSFVICTFFLPIQEWLLWLLTLLIVLQAQLECYMIVCSFLPFPIFPNESYNSLASINVKSPLSSSEYMSKPCFCISSLRLDNLPFRDFVVSAIINIPLVTRHLLASLMY
jgi:hypothetical protein